VTNKRVCILRPNTNPPHEYRHPETVAGYDVSQRARVAAKTGILFRDTGVENAGIRLEVPVKLCLALKICPNLILMGLRVR
jgi:hypothetical protein